MNTRSQFALCSPFQTSGGGMKVASISSQTQALRREWLSRVDPPPLSPVNRAPGARHSSFFRSTCTLQLDPQTPDPLPHQAAPAVPVVSPNSALHGADPNANAPPAVEPAAPMSSTTRSIAQQSARFAPAQAPNSSTALIAAASPQLNLSAARMSTPHGALRGPLSSSLLPDVALVSQVPGFNHKTPTSPRGAASQNSESQFPLEASTGQLDVPQTPTAANVISSVPGTPLRSAGNVTPTNKLTNRLPFALPPNSASQSANTSASGTPTQSQMPLLPGHMPPQSTAAAAAAVATPSRSLVPPTAATATSSGTHFQSQILRGALYSNSSQQSAAANANASLSRRGTVPAFTSNPKQTGETPSVTNGSHFAEDKPNLRWNQPESTRSSLTSVMGAVTNSIGAIAKAAAFGSQSTAAAAPLGGTLRAGTLRPDIVPPNQPPALASNALFGSRAGAPLSRGGEWRFTGGLFSGAGAGATDGSGSGSGGASIGRAQEAAPVPQSPAGLSGSAAFPQIIHTAPLQLHQQPRPGNFKSPAFAPHVPSDSSRAPAHEAQHSRASSSASPAGAGGSPGAVDGVSLGSDYDQPDLVSAHS